MYDVSDDTSAPVYIGSVDLDGIASDLIVEGTTLYALVGDEVVIHDVSAPGSGVVPAAPVHSRERTGDSGVLLHLTHRMFLTAGKRIFDVSNPAEPVDLLDVRRLCVCVCVCVWYWLFFLIVTTPDLWRKCVLRAWMFFSDHPPPFVSFRGWYQQ